MKGLYDVLVLFVLVPALLGHEQVKGKSESTLTTTSVVDNNVDYDRLSRDTISDSTNCRRSTRSLPIEDTMATDDEESKVGLVT